MCGKGWFNCARLASEMNIDKKFASQLIHRVGKHGNYKTETQKINGQKFIKVVQVEMEQVKLDKVARLWNLAIFGSAA